MFTSFKELETITRTACQLKIIGKSEIEGKGIMSTSKVDSNGNADSTMFGINLFKATTK